MSKLRLSVFNTQPPHLYFGGVERRIIETTKRMGETVQTTIFCGTKAGFRTPVRKDGAEIIPCFSTDAVYPVDNWFFNKTVSRTIGIAGADVFEAHADSGYGFQRILRKKKCQKPFVHTIHGVLADEYFQALAIGSLSLRGKLANIMMWQLSKLEAETAKNADLVVTISCYSRKKIVQLYGVDDSKIRIVPNGVDPQRFRPRREESLLKKRLGIGNRLTILFVGRLIPRKGLPYLVEAAKKVVGERKDTAFLIVGDGPLRNQLVNSLKKSRLTENFILLGDVADEALPAIYNCADIFVLPSIQEGQGIALLEAQSTGKPVVAFDTGAVREALQNGETGVLTKAESAAFAEAMLRLLHDESLRERMGRKGREFVSHNLSWEICADKMIEVYREAQMLV